MEFAFTPEIITMLVGIFGPLLVGVVTGLDTKSWVKAVLALLTSLGVAVGQLLVGGVPQDVIAMLLQTIVLWQASYSMIWKSTGIAEWLQANVPFVIDVVDGKLVISFKSA